MIHLNCYLFSPSCTQEPELLHFALVDFHSISADHPEPKGMPSKVYMDTQIIFNNH